MTVITHAAPGASSDDPVLISRFPRLLLGVSLLLWGYAIELMPLALALALAYEAAPLVPWRWRFTEQDFNRLVDLSALLFVVVALYQFDQRRVHGVYGVLQWLPGLLALLLLSQRYSERGGIPLAALFLRVRRAVARGQADGRRSVDFAYPYFVACLLSASAGSIRGDWFFPMVAVLLIWGLYRGRATGRHVVLWLVLVAVIIGLGFALQSGIKSTRRALEPLVMEFLRDYMAGFRDPFKSHTAIGELGELKLSEQIELRVHPRPGAPVPALLHEASYRQFSRNTWLTGARTLRPLLPTNGGLDWRISDPIETTQTVKISRYMPRGHGLLAVPDGTWKVTGLGVESLSRHPLGALKVGRGPELVEYEAHFDPWRSTVSMPEAIDLQVPRTYTETLSRWLSSRQIPAIGTIGETTGTIVAAVRRGLRDGYSYSVRLPSRISALPLREFLEENKTGHCEFYATATVLLLRQAGIPARYATGFAVSEWSPLEDAFVVRRRHAHSWASAFVNGTWIAVDTTPANWLVDEASDAPWWSDIYALASWLRHIYSQWRWRNTDDEDDSQPWLLWAAVPLIGYLVWRLRAERIRAKNEPDKVAQVRAGHDSAMLRVESALAGIARHRRVGEPLSQWLRAIAEEQPDSALDDIREVALPLHQRLRFHPAGITVQEHHELDEICARWLAHARRLRRD